MAFFNKEVVIWASRKSNPNTDYVLTNGGFGVEQKSDSFRHFSGFPRYYVDWSISGRYPDPNNYYDTQLVLCDSGNLILKVYDSRIKQWYLLWQSPEPKNPYQDSC